MSLLQATNCADHADDHDHDEYDDDEDDHDHDHDFKQVLGTQTGEIASGDDEVDDLMPQNGDHINAYP